ncbi:DNA adenine methylase [Aeribacillus sp. FSL K6-2848]|uniref:DNA adenine methylase n=1 Tax=unclassified Aeribacillus TaxID=2640495 RepID=UPI0030D13F7A
MGRYSPLRYPGGKRKLSNYVKLILKENELLDGTYVEPFAGGAGIALSLLIDGYVTKVVINDINKSIFAFWYSVLNKTDELCKLICDTPVTVEQWKKQKNVQKNAMNCSLLELGFSTFFLNRTNRSGILSGGVIGGLNQNGKYKIDARFNKKNLISRIEKIARYKNRILLLNLDASELITDVLPGLPQKTLVYLDPPYYHKGRDLYENHYSHEDHEFLAKLIRTKITQYWLLTYDNTPQIKEMYKGLRQKNFSLNYSLANKYMGSEIMFFCNQLLIPEVENPIKVSL